MIIDRPSLIAKLRAAGVPTARIEYFAGDEVGGVTFGTIDPAWVRASWDAWIEMDSGNPALVAPRDIGGGKTILVPRYTAPGYVCRHAAFRFFAHLLAGLAERAYKQPQQFESYAIGVVYYTAEPRAEDLNRDGRHARIIFVDDAGNLQQFEEGDGDPEPMTTAELASVTLLLFT